jgi:hypothetical protein
MWLIWRLFVQGEFGVDALSQFVDALVGGGKRWTRLASSPASLLA